ncbi:MAG TPA: MerR family transcriptional regulator [Candidatus Methylomirabilis sp.]|nr:MerR family transcriptional regulator [Candidatus Methylomirabilis sp.]
MRETVTISALAKQSGVPSKTLRFWESAGLLPKAARTHTGYRVFDSNTLSYIAFIRKSKSIGLTLAEIQEILRLARSGRCPCPEVVHWTQARMKAIDDQIRSLSALLRRLKRIERQWTKRHGSRGKCGEVCYLIKDLPEFQVSKGGDQDEKVLAHSDCCDSDNCCDGMAGDSGRKHVLSSVLPALPG